VGKPLKVTFLEPGARTAGSDEARYFAIFFIGLHGAGRPPAWRRSDMRHGESQREDRPRKVPRANVAIYIEGAL
jgi:hypothetical protein